MRLSVGRTAPHDTYQYDSGKHGSDESPNARIAIAARYDGRAWTKSCQTPTRSEKQRTNDQWFIQPGFFGHQKTFVENGFMATQGEPVSD